MRLTTSIPDPEIRDYLSRLFFDADRGPVEFRDGHLDSALIALTESQVRWLKTFDSEHDGYVDSDGTMWIGGDAYPLETVQNS